MDINIGISDADRARSAKAIKALLANTYTLYLKTHGYHWNVEGPHFPAAAHSVHGTVHRNVDRG